MRKINGLYLVMVVSLVMAGATMVVLTVIKQTQDPPKSRLSSSSTPLPSPTETQVTPTSSLPLAYLAISQDSFGYLSFYLLPTKKISPSAITLKLKLAPGLTLTQAQALSNRLKLNPWWQEQGFKLQLNRLNPKDKTLEFALIKLSQKDSLLLPNQSKPLFIFKTKLTPNQVKIVPSQSVIMLKDATGGLIELKKP